jgi:sigma-B regulation protein RsbU (phosphoserine phosphatase)
MTLLVWVRSRTRACSSAPSRRRAARIQADLFPAELPVAEGYELAAHNRSARRCGGDYYDALSLTTTAGSDLLLCVADVSGKGLLAALLMSNMQATLRALLGRTASLRVLAAHASDLLFAATSPEKYVTAALVQLAPATGAITFVGAGHLDNIILRASGQVVPLTSTGAACSARVCRTRRRPTRSSAAITWCCFQTA